jgi:hypothetical protein
MKESYESGVATHIGPESCGAAREGGVEALVGERAGRVFSRVSQGKGTSGSPARPKVLIRWAGAPCLVVARKRGNAPGAKGTGHPRRDGVNGQTEELLVLTEGGSLLWVARAG